MTVPGIKPRLFCIMKSSSNTIPRCPQKRRRQNIHHHNIKWPTTHTNFSRKPVEIRYDLSSLYLSVICPPGRTVKAGLITIPSLAALHAHWFNSDQRVTTFPSIMAPNFSDFAFPHFQNASKPAYLQLDRCRKSNWLIELVLIMLVVLTPNL